MAQEIVVIQQMGDALRNTGYKSIESAASEIIDNSIEAEAADIFVIVSEKTDERTGRKTVNDIAFLDNGNGMDLEKLQACLGIGYSTRSARRGMGRFGVGLPQASLYACPSVDVYSWQGGIDNCHKVFLDIHKVKAGVQKVIEEPQKTEIPCQFQMFLEYKTMQKQYQFMEHGTLVHWKNCDRVSPKTIRFLFQKLDFALGQKFRYLICENTHSIKLIQLENIDYSYDVMPNDPLFLMNPNYVLGDPQNVGKLSPHNNCGCTEPLFEVYTDNESSTGDIVVPVKYASPESGEILESHLIVKFSKVRDIFYDKTAYPGRNVGSTEMGKQAKAMEGISIVRANREIDFGQFDFYENINQPEHRWWGCEIRFDPILDEAFGVANNKQHVELKRVDPDDYLDEEVQPMWLQIYNVVHNTIEQMYKENKKTRENVRTTEDIITPSTEIINAVEEGNETKGEADSVRDKTPQEELIDRNIEALKEQGIPHPTVEDARTYMNNKLTITYKDLGRGPCFDYSFGLGNCAVTINTSHIFFINFVESTLFNSDAKVSFELFIAAFVKAVEETNLSQKEQNDNLHALWNEKLRKYINEQQGVAKN